MPIKIVSSEPSTTESLKTFNPTVAFCQGHKVVYFLKSSFERVMELFKRVNTFAYDSIQDQSAFPPMKSRIWQPRALPIDQAMQKMWKNARKAMIEHRLKDPHGVYPMEAEPMLPLEVLTRHSPLPPLCFAYTAGESRGPRPTMEDAHFFVELQSGALTGIFDGHGGRLVADYASEQFQNRFFDVLKAAQGNVHQAFETLIHAIHAEVAEHEEWNDQGSTAIISYIDKHTRLIYTATLGDSEANIYRLKECDSLQSIPLSCVRDWGSEKDAARAAIALGKPKIAKRWPKVPNPKILRFHGLNVSRSIGDTWVSKLVEHPSVIQKPKITINRLEPGDILTLACDGLKDYVSEKDIAKFIDEARGDHSAQQLADYAVDKHKAQDNVTVIVIKVS